MCAAQTSADACIHIYTRACMQASSHVKRLQTTSARARASSPIAPTHAAARTLSTASKLSSAPKLIEGRAILKFDDGGALTAVSDEIYFSDLCRRGQLRNRRCAQDLRLFLEVCRRPPGRDAIDWANAVDDALPWRGVPGSAALDLDDNEDDIGPVVVAFVGLAGVATIALTAALLGGGEIPPY